MNIERIFKGIITLEFLIIIFFLVSGFVLGAIQEVVSPSRGGIVFSSALVLLLILALIYIINLYFLYKFKPIGRKIYVPIIIIAHVLSLGVPFEAVQEISHFEYVLNDISTIIGYVIIAMIFQTDIKKKFEQ
ncbi:MAG: hypothetical protein V6Z81_10950 [Parvularculales bacterium]